MRNELVLDRVLRSLDAADLVGTWKVDLRPTPDADPYFAELRVTAAGDRYLEGSFYGTTIREARINLDWGALHFAFVTEDGSATYHTSGRLLADGSLAGTTHAIGAELSIGLDGLQELT